MKTVGVLTSGGDAPGMNAAVRAVVRKAIADGFKVKAILNGFDGLINGNVVDMNLSSVAEVITKGGTFLRTARSNEFVTPEGQEKAMKVIEEHGIDSIVVIGGDGSFKGANALHLRGIKTIGIPATIDNDMAYTEWTIGFTTACETVKDAVFKLRDTSASHGRVQVVEVMGRHCGDIALYAGVASGASYIIVPEVEPDLEGMVKKLKCSAARGKKQHIVVVAEGYDSAQAIVDKLNAETELETKLTVLGHIQRGGTPAMFDNLLASRLAEKAVELLEEGQSSQAVGIKEGKIFNMPITEAVEMKRVFNKKLYDLAHIISN